MSIFASTFFVTYTGLHVFIPSTLLLQSNSMEGNLLDDYNLLGLLFWIVFGTFLFLSANSKQNRYLILYFHILSAPYIYMVFFHGIPWETRLYIPLFLGGLFLAKYNLTKLSREGAYIAKIDPVEIS